MLYSHKNIDTYNIVTHNRCTMLCETIRSVLQNKILKRNIAA